MARLDYIKIPIPKYKTTRKSKKKGGKNATKK